MPYKSLAQEHFFHTPDARKKGITSKMVQEFDHASKGMKLVAKVATRPSPADRMKQIITDAIRGKK